MKKTIPFTKDIKFNTNIFEITSISLEHNLKINNNNTITGDFIVSGEYKEKEDSNKEVFIYNLPLNIDLDNKYNIDNSKIIIDDFNYEIKNNKLIVNIVLEIDNIDVVEEVIDKKIDDINDDREVNNKISIFNNFDDKDETYVTYNIHIIRENDTLDNIINLYKTTKEDIMEYNDINNLSIGTKLIIPNNE